MTSRGSAAGRKESVSGAALVESVAKALMVAINDPSDWDTSGISAGQQKRRCASEANQIAIVFDSSAVPPISVEKYLLRLFSSFRCSDATFVAALIVMDRLLEYDGGRIPLTMRNVHRVFLASLVVSVKYHEDRVYSNSHYAKSGGVQLREVNRLERVVLVAIDFDLRVQPQQYRLYESMLSKTASASHTSEPRDPTLNARCGTMT
eukprot:TRINITY_DN44958_c0_g1_i1.p1 TRINITY_DN44958_c0_g1~~TRINITY_DN44958_c0_g1_i1.p1  ORF type:complete len:206 (-),score=29.09 TRINITY_DN44958_c0_g1_i1:162-779(-)